MRVTSLLALLILSTACARWKVKKPHPIVGPLNARREQFRQCYHESDSYRGKDINVLKSDSMKVGFTLDPKGAVRNAKVVETTFTDPNLHACVLDVLKKTKFKSQGKEVEIVQPISFYEGTK